MEPEVSLPHSQVPSPVPVSRDISPARVPQSHFLKMLFNIILPSAV